VRVAELAGAAPAAGEPVAQVSPQRRAVAAELLHGAAATGRLSTAVDDELRLDLLVRPRHDRLLVTGARSATTSAPASAVLALVMTLAGLPWSSRSPSAGWPGRSAAWRSARAVRAMNGARAVAVVARHGS
jgi:hypothetical protein